MSDSPKPKTGAYPAYAPVSIAFGIPVLIFSVLEILGHQIYGWVWAIGVTFWLGACIRRLLIYYRGRR